MAYLRDLPLWLSAIVWAFLPSTSTPWIQIFSIPIDAKDCLIMFLFLYHMVICMYYFPIKAEASKGSHYLHFPSCIILIALYSVISMLWSNCEGRDRIAMGYTMAITVLAFFAAYFIVASRSDVDVSRLVDRMVWFVAFTGVVYFCESYFDIGLRSSEGRDSATFEFEIQRVHGPLFGAACGYFLLLPAIGAALDRVLLNLKTFVIDLAVLFALVVSLVGLGSRGAMISIVVFISTFVIINRNAPHKFMCLTAILVLFQSQCCWSIPRLVVKKFRVSRTMTGRRPIKRLSTSFHPMASVVFLALVMAGFGHGTCPMLRMAGHFTRRGFASLQNME